MSNVYQRERSESSLKWIDQATRIRVQILLLVHTKAIPKSWRFTFSVPMAQTARDLVDHLITAKEFYPNTEHNVLMRRHYMTLGVADCKHLLQDIQALNDCCSQMSANWYEEIVAMLCDEIKTIKGARKGVKLLKG